MGMGGMGGGGGQSSGNSWVPFAQAAIVAMGDRAGGWGPDFEKPLIFPSRKKIRGYTQMGWNDVKALRGGGIESPDLEYLGMGPNWRSLEQERLREGTEGTAIAGEQALRNSTELGYGGPTAKSGLFLSNLSRLRAGRQQAMTAAMRDLDLENYQMKWRNFYNMNNLYESRRASLTRDYNEALRMAYQQAMNRWQSRKGHFAKAAGSLSAALGGAYGEGSLGTEGMAGSAGGQGRV